MLLIAGKHPDSHQMSYTPLLHNEDPVLNDEFLGKVPEEIGMLKWTGLECPCIIEFIKRVKGEKQERGCRTAYRSLIN